MTITDISIVSTKQDNDARITASGTVNGKRYDVSAWKSYLDTFKSDADRAAYLVGELEKQIASEPMSVPFPTTLEVPDPKQ